MIKPYMEMAIKEAKKAYNKNEVPVGAVIVKEGKVIAKAHNNKLLTNLVTSHAEALAVEKACKKISDWRLNGCVMYVTLEPCKMCKAILEESRIDKVIYGTKQTKVTDLQNLNTIYEEMVDGQQECAQMMKDFFKSKRK